MKRDNYFLDNEDLQFHVNKKLDFQTLFNWLSKEEKDAVGADSFSDYKRNWIEVVETFGEICADLGSRAWQLEQEDIRLVDGEVEFPSTINQNMAILREFGIAGFSIHPKYGGMGAPFICDMIGAELLNRACPSTMLNAAWYGPIAHMIEAFGNDELKEKYIPLIASGELSGSMALTEPDAGSDLAALRTYAELQPDGSYKLFGTKRFISNGNGEISLVLAKSQKNAVGLDKLSLFLCPRKIDGQTNFKITNLEKKVALHGSATCELAFDGSQAWLVGKLNMGYRYMLRLMNDSRLGVGFQGIGLLEAAFREAKSYALTRKSWGKTLNQHELIAEMLLDWEVELKAMRSLGLYAAMQRTMENLGSHYVEQCSQKERQSVFKKLANYEHTVRSLTPLIKYWTGERSFALARSGYQILGGYGFTKEYKAEWLLRESLIYSVYEGTSQMQALMCVKDTLKQVVKNPKLFVQQIIADSYRSIIERHPLQKKVFQIKQISNRATLDILFKLIKANMRISLSLSSKSDLFKMAKIVKDELTKFENFSPALLHAERLCAIKSLEAMSERVVDDAMVDKNRSWIAQRFCHTSLQKVKYLKDQVEKEESVLAGRLTSYAQKQSTDSAPLMQTAEVS